MWPALLPQPSARQLASAGFCALLGCASAQDATWLSGSAAPSLRPGGDLTSTVSDATAFAQRAPNSLREQQLYFNSGLGFYQQAWLPAPSVIETRSGLGPLFNAAACIDCHVAGGRARPPLDATEPFVGLVLRVGTGARAPGGEPEPDGVYGAQLQTRALDGTLAEGTPHLDSTALDGSYADGEPYSLAVPSYRITPLLARSATAPLRLSPRVAPATIGLGLLEAIPEQRLLELEDAEDRDGDGISGRANRVWDRQRQQTALGRFGWKAEQPDLRQQTAAALAADLGITSALYPEADCAGVAGCRADAGEPELSERALDRLQSYLRLLAVPARRDADEPAVQRGGEQFRQLGCDACHVPSHVTRANAALPELAQQTIWPYTDLLLHDLGPALADERPSFSAESSEWRTPPLWGLGLLRSVDGHDRLLHDGRARGVAEAILWHGGEASAARDAFRALPQQERQELIDFVESL